MFRFLNCIKKHLIFFSTILAALIIYPLFILSWQKNYYSHHVNIHGIYLLRPIKVEKFESMDHRYNTFTNQNLKNHWSLLFFGFTQCQMICPVTLSSLNIFYQEVGKKVSRLSLPQIIFITLDPARDSTDKLAHYIGQFNKNFIGLRTSIEHTDLLQKQFHVTSQKTQEREQNAISYQFNHSSQVILINPHAEIQAYFSFPIDPAQLVKDYMAILGKNKIIN